MYPADDYDTFNSKQIRTNASDVLILMLIRTTSSRNPLCTDMSNFLFVSFLSESP